MDRPLLGRSLLFHVRILIAFTEKYWKRFIYGIRICIPPVQTLFVAEDQMKKRKPTYYLFLEREKLWDKRKSGDCICWQEIHFL
mmetsp:Transcript_4744/g.8439  ORF Transcript_4744/g.8439 Transcript_4744/m.8439 type:complete len:84 (-) Transcript_4744:58-309(-)